MNRTKRLKSSLLQTIPILLAAVIFIFSACSKGDGTEAEEPEGTGTAVPFYKLQRVENLAVETDDENPTAEKTEVLFSLEFKKEQPLSYARTNLWDLSLSGLYNSFMGGNNGSNSSNYGTGGPGKGGIMIVDKPFDEVISIPADSEFKTAKGLIGTDDSGAFGEGTGWYLYDFGGLVMGDGSFDKQHVAYALGNALTKANGQPAPIRTVVLRTAKGNYAKIKMISCYKDAYTPEKMLRNTPHMYFTFEYVIVPAGSTKFELK